MLLIRNNANCIALETPTAYKKKKKKKELISSPTNIFASIYSGRAPPGKRERKGENEGGWAGEGGRATGRIGRSAIGDDTSYRRTHTIERIPRARFLERRRASAVLINRIRDFVITTD